MLRHDPRLLKITKKLAIAVAKGNYKKATAINNKLKTVYDKAVVRIQKRAAEDVQQAGPNYIRNRIAEYKQEFGELSVDGIQNKEAEYNLKLIKKSFAWVKSKSDSVKREIFDCVAKELQQTVYARGRYTTNFLHRLFYKEYSLVEAINKSDIKRVEQIINALTNCFNYLNYHAEFFFTDEYRFTLSQFLDKPIDIERSAFDLALSQFRVALDVQHFKMINLLLSKTDEGLIEPLFISLKQLFNYIEDDYDDSLIIYCLFEGIHLAIQSDRIDILKFYLPFLESSNVTFSEAQKKSLRAAIQLSPLNQEISPLMQGTRVFQELKKSPETSSYGSSLKGMLPLSHGLLEIKDEKQPTLDKDVNLKIEPLKLKEVSVQINKIY